MRRSHEAFPDWPACLWEMRPRGESEEGHPRRLLPIQVDETVPEGGPRTSGPGDGLQEVHHAGGARRFRQVCCRGSSVQVSRIGVHTYVDETTSRPVCFGLRVSAREGQVELPVPRPHHVGPARAVQQGQVRGRLEAHRLSPLSLVRGVRPAQEEAVHE